MWSHAHNIIQLRRSLPNKLTIGYTVLYYEFARSALLFVTQACMHDVEVQIIGRTGTGCSREGEQSEPSCLQGIVCVLTLCKLLLFSVLAIMLKFRLDYYGIFEKFFCLFAPQSLNSLFHRTRESPSVFV